MKVLRIINEEVKRLFQQKTYNIPELGKTTEYLGYDEDNQQYLTSLLANAFRNGGDDAVIDAYKQMAGVEIEALSKGRYIFANLYDPEASQHHKSVVPNMVNEELNGNNLYGYHATPCENVNQIKDKGFVIGDRQMQGRGVYGFYNLSDNTGGNAAIGYGERHVNNTNFCVVKFEITNPNYLLILDKKIAYDILGDNGGIIKQIESAFDSYDDYWDEVSKHFREEYQTNEYYKQFKLELINDFNDNNVKNLMFGAANLEQLNHFGVIFDGEYGMEFLIKYPKLMKPIGYHEVNRVNGRLETSELIPFDKDVSIKDIIYKNEKYKPLWDDANDVKNVNDLMVLKVKYQNFMNSVRNNRDYEYYENNVNLIDELISNNK